MPTTSRPDLLPLAKPARIGLPYHGLCKNGKVGAVDHTQPATGDCLLVQHPLATAPTLPNGEGENWQNYALLSGPSRQIGGQALGAQRWIYCDSRYSWVISFDMEKAGVEQTVSVWLESPFGIFPAPTMTRRKLGEITYTPLSYAGTAQSLTAAGLARRYLSSHSKTGSVSVINVAAYTPSPPYHSWKKSCLPFDIRQIAFGAYGLHNAIKVLIEGDGLLTTGHVGEGITATLSMLRTAPEMIVTETSATDTTGEYFGSNIVGDYSSEDPLDGEVELCPDPPPANGAQGTTRVWWFHYAIADPAFPEYEEGFEGSSSETTTTSSTAVYRFYDTVKPDGALSYLEIGIVVESEATHANAVTGDIKTYETPYVYDAPFYPCQFGHVNYDPGKTTYVFSGTSVYHETKSYSLTATVSASWCGATSEVTYTKTADAEYTSTIVEAYPGAPATFVTESVGDPSLPLEYACESNGAGIDCADLQKAYVYRNTNGVMTLFDASTGALTRMTLLGSAGSIAFLAGASEVSLNPMSGALTAEAGASVCYV